MTSGAIEQIGGGAKFGDSSDVNLLAEGAAVPYERIIIWSGWDPESRIGEDVWSASFATWGPSGRARFQEAYDRRVGHGTLVFRPHARHVLSDARSCVSFLNERAGDAVEVLLDPSGMLTPDMLAGADDHLARAFEAMAPHPRVTGLVLSNVERVGEELRACPLTRGLLDVEVLLRLASEHWDDRSVLIVGDEIDEQVELVRGAGI